MARAPPLFPLPDPGGREPVAVRHEREGALLLARGARAQPAAQPGAALLAALLHAGSMRLRLVVAAPLAQVRRLLLLLLGGLAHGVRERRAERVNNGARQTTAFSD